MTQEQLANALGITFQAVSKWENGISSPDLSTLPLLADLFGVSVDQLLGRDALPREEERLTAPVPVEEQFQERQEQEEEAVQAAEPEQTPDAEAEPVYAEPGQDLPWPDGQFFYGCLLYFDDCKKLLICWHCHNSPPFLFFSLPPFSLLVY